MRSWIGLSLAVAVLGGALTAAASAATLTPNMVCNGDFEAGETAGLGRDWVNESYGTGKWQFSLEADRPHSGKYCQHMHVEGLEDGGAQIRQLGMKLIKGQPYTIGLWLRGNLAVPVTVGFREHAAPFTFYLKQEVRVTPAWQRFTVTGVASDTDANAGLYIFVPGNGDLWVDDVSARADTPGTPPITGSH